MTHDGKADAGKADVNLIPPRALAWLLRARVDAPMAASRASLALWRATGARTHLEDAIEQATAARPTSEVVERVQRVLDFGVRKYRPEGWRVVPNAIARYTAAAERHARLATPNSHDEESRLPHLDHYLTNLFFLLDLTLEAKEGSK
jgi:hypothetical protein